jgi:glycosyltransferase involved in cell wall biosynthesis
VPEIVEDGRTGLLARAGDVESLAARMREAIAASPERLASMGEAARARVVEQFSVRAMRDGYARVYAEVAGAP